MFDLEQRGPRGLRSRQMLAIAGGPVAHLLFGVVLALVARGGGGMPFWIAAGLVSALALLELVPVDAPADRLARSDGFRLWQWLVVPGRQARSTATNALVQALRIAARRPRDWDPRWVELASGHGEPAVSMADVAAGLLVSYHAVDRGSFEPARRPLLTAYAARALLKRPQRLWLAGWTAFCLARFDRDAGEAARIIGAESDWAGREYAYGLAAAALSLAAGRADDALARCDWLLLVSLDSADGFHAMVRDQVEALRADAVVAN